MKIKNVLKKGLVITTAIGMISILSPITGGKSLAYGGELIINLPVFDHDSTTGNGTKDDPFIIYDADGLSNFRDNVNKNGENYTGKYIKLGEDIDLSSVCGEGKGDWEPITLGGGTLFRGTFDGDGHTISGLYIGNGDNNVGLFGVLETHGLIKNLHVNGYVNSSGRAGGIVGHSFGCIENCSFSGTVTSTGNRAGGIAGESCDVISCKVDGNIDAYGDVGGIVGFLKTGSKVDGCSFSGTVLDKQDFGGVIKRNVEVDDVGGIAGDIMGSIINCKAEGDIKGYLNVGGIAGGTGSTGTVSKCVFSQGMVYASARNAGGIVGYHCGVKISECKNYGSVKVGNERVGGIAGFLCGSVVSCENRGNVAGGSYAGGIAGESSQCNGSKGTMEYCVNYGEISGDTNVGGVIGYARYGIAGCSNRGGKVTGNSLVGDFLGDMNEGVTLGEVGSSFSDGNWLMIGILTAIGVLAMFVASLIIKRRRKMAMIMASDPDVEKD